MKRTRNLLQTQIIAQKMTKELESSSYGYSLADDFFVGLPATGLKRRWVQLIVEPDGPAAVAPVGSVGPWNGGGTNNKYDDRYWIGRKRPQSESGIDLKGRKTNKAGLEISHSLWKKMGLGKKRKVMVRWQFVKSPQTKKVMVATDSDRFHITN